MKKQIKQTNKKRIETAIKELTLKKGTKFELGCYNVKINKVKDIDKITSAIEFADTDIQVFIDEQPYIVEIVKVENQFDFYIISKYDYINNYGINEEDYEDDFN